MLAIFAASIGFSVRNLIDVTRRFDVRSELRYIAKAGVEKAMAVLEEDLKRENFSDFTGEPWSANEKEFKEMEIGSGYVSVRYQHNNKTYFGLVDEQSRININQVEDSEILKRLLASASDAGPEAAEEIADAILDWKDADDEKREKGAEADYYRSLRLPYEPANRSLTCLEELLFVRGVTYRVFDQIRPYLTIRSDGKINLNTATKPVLIALGLDSALADHIIRYRAGIDQIERTPDDRYFESLDLVVSTLKSSVGISDSDEEVLTKLLSENKFTISSALFSVESEGHLRGRKDSLVINAVVTKEGRILSWHEMFQVV